MDGVLTAELCRCSFLINQAGSASGTGFRETPPAAHYMFGSIEMNKIMIGKIILMAGIAGAAIALIYSVLAVSGPPYFRGPWIIGLLIGFLTMPALLIQELFPASWVIKYNWLAVIAGNGLWYSVLAAISCLVGGAIRKHRI